jgi:hypothetical protein
VRGELFSIVVGDCFDAVGQRQEHARAGLYDSVRALVRQLGELGVFGFSFDMRHHSASVIGTDNCVGLPVSDAVFCGDNGRSLIDVDAVRNQPASRILALPLVVFLLAALASPPAIKALDPDPFPCRSLRHAVYAALLTSDLKRRVVKATPLVAEKEHNGLAAEGGAERPADPEKGTPVVPSKDGTDRRAARLAARRPELTDKVRTGAMTLDQCTVVASLLAQLTMRCQYATTPMFIRFRLRHSQHRLQVSIVETRRADGEH